MESDLDCVARHVAEQMNKDRDQVLAQERSVDGYQDARNEFREVNQGTVKRILLKTQYLYGKDK